MVSFQMAQLNKILEVRPLNCRDVLHIFASILRSDKHLVTQYEVNLYYHSEENLHASSRLANTPCMAPHKAPQVHKCKHHGCDSLFEAMQQN